FLAMAAGMPIGGLVSDSLLPFVGRLRARQTVAIVGQASASAFLFIALSAESPEWISAWLSLSMGSLGMAEPAFWATVIDSAGKRGGTASAFLNAGNNGFGLLAPVVTPYVVVYFEKQQLGLGWTYALALAGIAAFGAAMSWFFV